MSVLKERLEELVDNVAARINALTIVIFGPEPQPLQYSLETTDRSSLVAAINEVVRRLNAIENPPQ